MTETLTPLLVKWLMHDFATPIATVMTASELLGPVADAEINGLVADAAKRLGGRLQLVRAAMAPGSGPMGAAGLEKLLRAGLDATPLSFAIPADHVGDGAHCAVLACAALLLADLRRGQPLTIAANRIDWATPAAFPDAVGTALAGGPASDSRSAVAAMLIDAAARADVAVTVTETGVTWA
jgi:hypothetical protein